MRTFQSVRYEGAVDPPLSSEDLLALERACAPADQFAFPPIGVMRTLRQLGYVEIVIGGLQVTPRGLERLVRERARRTRP